MEIGVISANFGRLPILKIFCAGIARLRRETGLAIPCVVAGDISGAEVCDSYNIEHIICRNYPLTGKFNTACEALKGRVDYVMVMGSDNLISTMSFNRVIQEAERGIDLIGFNDVYFYGLDDIYAGKLFHFKHTEVLGVGRTIKASILDKFKWRPWVKDADRGIDRRMLNEVTPLAKTNVLLRGGAVIDLKTNWNLNHIRSWANKLGVMSSDNLIWDMVGPEEANLIKQYINR